MNGLCRPGGPDSVLMKGKNKCSLFLICSKKTSAIAFYTSDLLAKHALPGPPKEHASCSCISWHQCYHKFTAQIGSLSYLFPIDRACLMGIYLSNVPDEAAALKSFQSASASSRTRRACRWMRQNMNHG